MSDETITVLIVDDSKVSRDLLSYIVELDPQIKVIGFAENGIEGLEFIARHKPDVIMTDIEMPKMNGFEFTRKIMETNPIPIIVVSGVYNQAEVATGFEAIEVGALAIIEKPKGLGDSHCMDTARFVAETIKTMAKVKLKVDVHSDYSLTRKKTEDTIPPIPEASNIEKWKPCKIEAIAIGASIGGPKAIRFLLSQLPRKFSLPIYIVQHITSGFIDGFINWLNNSTTFEVKLAKEGEEPKPGVVYICPDAQLMRVTTRKRISLQSSNAALQAEKSISTLFESIRTVYHGHCIGILLTGIGRDGAKELLKLKEEGAYTIVQDEASSVKFDLPKSAIECGAAHCIAPLHKIPLLLERVIDEKANKNA